MKCHYEVLEVARDANVDEVRKAYLKQSLRCHPDKNPIEQAAEFNALFTLIKRAYEVLSDPQERAWYDRHREAILKAEEHGNLEKEAEAVDLLQYFTTSCYTTYDESPTGFYTVFRHAFEQIAAEEMRHAEDVKNATFPPFGNSSSDDEDVKAFYDFWNAFSTYKSYDWVDTYKPEYGMANRQVYRHFDKQSKKVRDQLRAERNDTIRSLAEFVRKRDPRAKRMRRLAEQRAREQQEALQQKLVNQKQAHIEERRRIMENASRLAEDDESAEHFEAALRTLEQQNDAGDAGADEIGQYDAESSTALYCLVCEKDFRTLGQKENHMRSKQHKKAAETLREHMIQQNMQIEALAQQLQNVDVKELRRQLNINVFEEGQGESRTESVDTPVHTADVENVDKSAAGDNNDVDLKPNKKQAKRKQRRKQAMDIDSDADDYSKSAVLASENAVVAATLAKPEGVTNTAENVIEPVVGENELVEIIDAPLSASSDTKPGKKPASGSAPAAVSHNQTKRAKALKKKLQIDDDDENGTATKCKVCKVEFNTRNKLFKHIKDTGHASLKVV